MLHPLTSSPGLTGGSSTPRDFVSITDTSEYWIVRRSLSLGGHSADPLADDDERRHSRDIMRPSFANSFAPKGRGRREDRVRAAPAVSRARVDKKRTRAYRFSGSSPAFPAQWFYGLYRALPGETWLVCHRRPRDAKHHTNLTPAIGASGPHDFAVRVTRCSSKAHPRPPLPAPTSVTMANAPSLGTGWQGISR
jgi:hypothetical protein